MGRKYAVRNQQGIHFVTFTVVNWIDVFTRNEYKDVFVNSIKYCQKSKGLIVYAWCIMTNHVHLILSVEDGFELSNVIRDLKSFTSRHIRKEIEGNKRESRKSWMLKIMTDLGLNKTNNKDFQFWQQHNHPIELDSNEMMDSRLEYLHNNPVTGGFVEKPEDWIYSSAGDYCSFRKGKIDLVYIE